MSFGTGHHATTALMIEHQMQINHQGKKVMDVGSGTAVLAIMAEKLGATEILAFDIEDWAVENAIEKSRDEFEQAVFQNEVELLENIVTNIKIKK